MPSLVHTRPIALTPPRQARAGLATPLARRAALLAIVGLAAIAGFAATGRDQTAAAIAVTGADFARLMRFMTVVKLLFAATATAGLLWRLGSPASWPRFTSYAIAAALMAAGPELIWGMVHLRLGALLLHGGLAALVVLLWRDPATGRRVAELVAARRQALRS